MAAWEYDKIDLNNALRKTDDIDLLNQVGKQGWELVSIASNNVAYVKRPIANESATTVTPRRASKRPPTAATTA
jgi:hypothetical protein